jgi:hypothetical protein
LRLCSNPTSTSTQCNPLFNEPGQAFFCPNLAIPQPFVRTAPQRIPLLVLVTARLYRLGLHDPIWLPCSHLATHRNGATHCRVCVGPGSTPSVIHDLLYGLLLSSNAIYPIYQMIGRTRSSRPHLGYSQPPFHTIRAVQPTAYECVGSAYCLRSIIDLIMACHYLATPSTQSITDWTYLYGQLLTSYGLPWFATPHS